MSKIALLARFTLEVTSPIKVFLYGGRIFNLRCIQLSYLLLRMCSFFVTRGDEVDYLIEQFAAYLWLRTKTILARTTI
jgi:hypothetical protein